MWPEWELLIALLHFPRPCIWCTELWKASLFPCPYHPLWFHHPRGKNPPCLLPYPCSRHLPQSEIAAPPTPLPRPCPTPLNLPQLPPQHQPLPPWVPDPLWHCCFCFADVHSCGEFKMISNWVVQCVFQKNKKTRQSTRVSCYFEALLCLSKTVSQKGVFLFSDSGWCCLQTRLNMTSSSVRQTVTWTVWFPGLKSETSSSKLGCPLQH